MSWELALGQIAYVAGECVAVREAGFTEEALRYPRSEAGLVALCAFNGIKPEQAPRGWHYWPGAGMKACWERVIEALWERSVTAIQAELAQGIEAASAAETVKLGSVHESPVRVANAPEHSIHSSSGRG